MLTGKLTGDADPKSQSIKMPQYHWESTEMDRKTRALSPGCHLTDRIKGNKNMYTII